MTSMFRFPAALFVLAVVTGSEALALSCNGKIVSEGDDIASVLVACGKPATREERQEVVIIREDGGAKREQTVTIEEWTYNFGPDRLIQVLTFRNGTLANIRSGGYGYRNEAVPGTMCGDRFPSIGQTKAEVLLACGEPFSRAKSSETVTERVDEKTKREVLIPVEEWTYNFGPDRFVRVFRFRDNRLVEIRLGDYGK